MLNSDCCKVISSPHLQLRQHPQTRKEKMTSPCKSPYSSPTSAPLGDYFRGGFSLLVRNTDTQYEYFVSVLRVWPSRRLSLEVLHYMLISIVSFRSRIYNTWHRRSGQASLFRSGTYLMVRGWGPSTFWGFSSRVLICLCPILDGAYVCSLRILNGSSSCLPHRHTTPVSTKALVSVRSRGHWPSLCHRLIPVDYISKAYYITLINSWSTYRALLFPAVVPSALYRNQHRLGLNRICLM